MKKISLLALAVPALFAACSQDELVTDAQNQQSTELLGEVAGKVDFVLEQNPLTRVEWEDNTPSPTWTDTDKFSMFWVGATGENTSGKDTKVYKAAANAVYFEESGKFTSQSVLYVGKHILVSPADLTHVTDKEILVKVGAEQKESVAIGDRTILVSDKLIEVKNIENKKEDDPEGTIYAGYNAEVGSIPVAALSTNFLLNLDFGTKYEADVVVNKVELIANKEGAEPFVTEANLFVNTNGHVSATPTTNGTTNKLTVVFPENQLIPEGGVLPVHFSMLPSVVDDLKPTSSTTGAGEEAVTTTTYPEYEIIVYTNYGKVSINNASLVYKGSGENKVYQYDGEIAEDATLADIAELPLSFYDEFLDCAVRDIDDPTTTDKDETDNSYGNHIIRTATVDMSTADINDMVIETSADIIQYYGVYAKLGKTDTEAPATFILQPTTTTFEMTKAAADLVLDADYANITLNNANVAIIKLVNTTGTFDEVPAFTTIKKDDANDLENIDLILGAGTWNLNVNDAANFNAWKSITNEGTLTVANAATTAATLNKSLTNKATVTFAEVNFPVTYTQTGETATTTLSEDIEFAKMVTIEDGDLTIAANKQAYFADAESDGEITVNGYLNAVGNFENNGTLTNNAVVIIAAGGYFVNNNEMEVTADANRTYINANAGTITIAERDANLVISEAANQGTIAYTGVDADYAGNEFVGKASDKFNKLTVTQADLDLTKLNAAGIPVTSLVLAVNPGGFVEFTFANGAEFDELVLGVENNTVFTSVDFISNSLTIGDLTVMPKTELHVKPETNIYYTGSSIDNQGSIAVGGVFTATSMMEPTGDDIEKKYKSAGYGGSFVWNSAYSKLVTDIANATAGSTITLTNNITLPTALKIEKNITIDLNGKTISNTVSDTNGESCETSGKACAVFYINDENVKLTIEGEGNVTAAATDASYNIPVWVRNGEATINGGNFVSGADVNGGTSHAVYAMKKAVVYITSGTFKAEGDPTKNKADFAYVLNGHDGSQSKIYLSGGKFYKFNEANSKAVGYGEVVVLNENFKWSETAVNEYYSVVAK